MNYDIYLLNNFNNYYNRKVRKLNSLQEYITLSSNSRENINISMGNSINIEIIVNYDVDHPFTNSPDYAVIVEKNTGVTYGTNKFTRWFVIDSEKIRGNQYRLSLKRDSVADYFDDLLLSDCYIEKGYHNNSDARFNKEPFQFNKIKQSQISLYDECECPWVIGYISKQKTIDSTIVPIPSNGLNISLDYLNIIPKKEVTHIEDWEYYDKVFYKLVDYRLFYNTPIKNGSSYYEHSVTINKDGSWSFNYPNISQSEYNNMKADYVRYAEVNTTESLFLTDISLYSSRISNAYKNLSSYYKTVIDNVMNNNIDNDELMEVINSYNNEYIKDTSTNKLYKIEVRYQDEHSGYVRKEYVDYTSRDLVYEAVRQPFSGNVYGNIIKPSNPNTPSPSCMKLQRDIKFYKVYLYEVTNSNVKLFPNHSYLLDSQYDMFALPYGNVKFKKGSNIITSRKEYALPIAQAISKNLGEYIYDVQLVPYCPVRDYLYGDKNSGYYIDLTGLTQGVDYVPIRSGDETYSNDQSYLLWCTKSVYENVTLNHTIEIDDIKKDIDLKEYRLTSPNFSSSFEFSAGKNLGVNNFIVSYDYKPYTPYIRVRPNFKNLYGEDYRDARGIIYSGNLSVTMLTDQWVQYQLNNKNYQNTFDREIQSMELNKKWNVAESIVGSISGTVKGALAGTFATRNPIGGVAGGVVSAAGGIADITKTVSLGNDSIDKAKDLFNYQLENIQALPNTISKMTSITVDNSGVPLLEIYGCLDTEEAQYDKLIEKYGQTIMRVGKIYDYSKSNGTTFIQGTIIKFNEENINEEGSDNTLVKDISSELNKGLYITN